ncbi:MAG: nicotinate-nucleotide adenylyltransferase [Proteobacteria bacterium]|nr:nicotinate-nucleotide adenylyltransferase [Pseudomonadota bacterium]MBU1638952.1 nicotinate-nucleotide adenylyltransferase [Pseudomonadota bacterium]
MAMVKSAPERLGILGGTFDPVHLGHIAVAQAALDALALDEVLFIPSCKPPHKVELALAPFSDRLAMLRLALVGHLQFPVSALEGERQDLSYTIDTLKELRSRLPEETTLFFLMGFDAFVEMATWKRYRDIPRFADIVVINRPHARLGGMDAAVHDVFGVQGGVVQEKPGQWRLTAGGHIHELIMAEVPLSSTAIRRALAQGDDVSAMLHPDVAAYIQKHGLYRR